MAQLNKLEKRYLDLTHEILKLFLEGEGCQGTNQDVLKYKSGTIEKINDLLSRRTEISHLLDEKEKS